MTGDLGLWTAVLSGAVTLATAVTLAALGEVLVERAGRLNIGIEGMMLAGAFASVWAASWGGAWTGVVTGMLAAVLLGALMNVAVYRWRADEVVAGVAIAMLGAGLTTYLFQLWVPSGATNVSVDLLTQVSVPVLDRIPLIGPALFQQSVLTYLTVVLVVAGTWGLAHTRTGLRLRACGDDPVAAALRGVDVVGYRRRVLLAGAALAGLGGAAITVADVGSFTSGITSGRGYVALAVVIIGRRTPWGAAGGALLFSFFDSLSLLVQGDQQVPVEVYQALPYLVTLVVLGWSARRTLRSRLRVARTAGTRGT